MPDPPQPTPYAEVNALLSDLLAQVPAILGAQFVGLYLVGSLAVGDFDPHTSDVDLVIVTDGELTADQVGALREMHAHLAAGVPWAAKVEAVYIPQHALRHPAPPAARYPQLEKGGTLELAPLEDAWSVQRYTLREYGRALAGPDPATLLDPTDPQAMHREGLAIAAGWLAQAGTDPAWLAWLGERANQAFVVLTLCRLLYTLETGAVASKPEAARWAQARLGRRWAALIARAVTGQQDHGPTTESDANRTVALIAYTVERLRQGAPGPA